MENRKNPKHLKIVTSFDTKLPLAWFLSSAVEQINEENHYPHSFRHIQLSPFSFHEENKPNSCAGSEVAAWRHHSQSPGHPCQTPATSLGTTTEPLRGPAVKQQRLKLRTSVAVELGNLLMGYRTKWSDPNGVGELATSNRLEEQGFSSTFLKVCMMLKHLTPTLKCPRHPKNRI